MKRFITSALFVAVFFIGVGSIAKSVGAKFKSDEKALNLIAQARQAIGGSQNISGIRSLSIKGSTIKTISIDGASRSEQGEMEVNMQLPDKFSKMVRIGKPDGEGIGIERKTMDVVVVSKDGENAEFTVNAKGNGEAGEKKVIKIRQAGAGTVTATGDGAKHDVIMIRTPDGKAGEWKGDGEVRKVVINDKGHGAAGAGGEFRAHRGNEMLRTSLALLLTAPEGVDVAYTYTGEESVDGSACDVINIDGAGSAFRLYLDKSSHLPRMISFEAPKPMIFAIRGEKGDVGVPPAGEPAVFARTMGAPEMGQFQIKFSDFRSVNGVQLPYKWVQTVGGNDDETVDITSYDVNPTDIGSKFQNEKVFIRTKQPETQK